MICRNEYKSLNVTGLYAYNRHGDDGREETELSYVGCSPTEHPGYAIMPLAYSSTFRLEYIPQANLLPELLTT